MEVSNLSQGSNKATMNICKINNLNSEALNSLENQNWTRSQKLFFQNVKENPCHETFNNLGYYLCTEGLECKNGKIRNAEILGMKYLIKACKLRLSETNLLAIATAIEARNDGVAKNPEGFCTYQNAYRALNKAIQLHYTYETEYNRLRFLYLTSPYDIEVLNGLEKLLKAYKTEDSVPFYLHVLCMHSMLEKCICFAKENRKYIQDEDFMTISYLCGDYQSGCECFESIFKQIVDDKTLCAIMVECLIKGEKFKEAKFYAEYAANYESSLEYRKKEYWSKLVFDNLNKSTPYRLKLISDYKYFPAYITPCCYFGCKIHNTEDICVR